MSLLLVLMLLVVAGGGGGRRAAGAGDGRGSETLGSRGAGTAAAGVGGGADALSALAARLAAKMAVAKAAPARRAGGTTVTNGGAEGTSVAAKQAGRAGVGAGASPLPTAYVGFCEPWGLNARAPAPALERDLKRAAGDALRLATAMLPLHRIELVPLDQYGNALDADDGGAGDNMPPRSADLAFCPWTNILWGVMGNETALGESNPMVLRKRAWERCGGAADGGAAPGDQRWRDRTPTSPRFDVVAAVAAAGRSASATAAGKAGGGLVGAESETPQQEGPRWVEERFLAHVPSRVWKEQHSMTGSGAPGAELGEGEYASGVEGAWAGGVWWPRDSVRKLGAVPHARGRPLLIGSGGESHMGGYANQKLGPGLRFDIELAAVGEAIPALATAAIRFPEGQHFLAAKRSSRMQHYGDVSFEDVAAKLARPTSEALARAKARYRDGTRFAAFYHYGTFLAANAPCRHMPRDCSQRTAAAARDWSCSASQPRPYLSDLAPILSRAQRVTRPSTTATLRSAWCSSRCWRSATNPQTCWDCATASHRGRPAMTAHPSAEACGRASIGKRASTTPRRTRPRSATRATNL